jgi:hypothetical protein
MYFDRHQRGQLFAERFQRRQPDIEDLLHHRHIERLFRRVVVEQIGFDTPDCSATCSSRVPWMPNCENVSSAALRIACFLALTACERLPGVFTAPCVIPALLIAFAISIANPRLASTFCTRSRMNACFCAMFLTS